MGKINGPDRELPRSGPSEPGALLTLYLRRRYHYATPRLTTLLTGAALPVRRAAAPSQSSESLPAAPKCVRAHDNIGSPEPP
jgi:hypothetical protein